MTWTFKLIEMELYIVMNKQRLTPAGDNVQAIYSQRFSVHRKILLLLFTSPKTVAFLNKEGRLQGNDKASQLPVRKKVVFGVGENKSENTSVEG